MSLSRVKISSWRYIPCGQARWILWVRRDCGVAGSTAAERSLTPPDSQIALAVERGHGLGNRARAD
jgi:hypothetical protein